MGLDTVDATLTLKLVVYGFFLIAIVQLIGIFGGDKSPLQDALLALLGFVLYLSIGAKTAAVTAKVLNGDSAYAGCASMCILTSLVYLVDFVFSLINLKNAQSIKSDINSKK